MSSSRRRELPILVALGCLYLLWAASMIALSPSWSSGLIQVLLISLIPSVWLGLWALCSRGGREPVNSRKELDDALPKKPKGKQANRFSQRLSRYLHVSEERVLNPPPARPSQMTFWSMVPLPGERIEKSIEYIRQILMRIHAAVHGEDSTDRD